MFGCPSNEEQFLISQENERPEEQMQPPLVMRGCVDSEVELPSKEPESPERDDPSRQNLNPYWRPLSKGFGFVEMEE